MCADASHPINPKFAWRDYLRQGLPKRSARERVRDFLEIYGLMDEAAVREQASRCIQCPNPSCTSGCPLCNPIPQWMQLTAEGRFLEAAAVVGSATNLAEICARVCPSERLCEHTCILDSVSEPVSIASIEQFLADYALKHNLLETSTPPPNGRKVAILGSGPGALTCAEELAKLGYSSTIIDSAVVPGGLQVNGTPAFRLHRSIVQRRLDLLKKRGVVFRLGENLPWCLGTLRQEFDAIYVTLDARQSRALSVPGVDLPGVAQAIPFLLQKNTALSLDAPPIELGNARVLVIGGGDVALDASRTALRCQAREVTCCYRRDEASLPCSAHEYVNAREEGVRFLFQVTPTAILAGSNGRARAVRFTRNMPASLDASGRTEFMPRPESQLEVEADVVIQALGFTAQPLAAVAGLEELGASDNGSLKVNEHQMTNLAGVFAGGDLVRGPSFVLDTVRDGRNAAAHIHAFLNAHRSA